MSDVDTSAEAVERLVARAQDQSACDPECQGRCQICPEFIRDQSVATLRALLAERDALRAQASDILAENDALRFTLNNAALATARRESAAEMREKAAGKAAADLWRCPNSGCTRIVDAIRALPLPGDEA